MIFINVTVMGLAHCCKRSRLLSWSYQVPNPEVEAYQRKLASNPEGERFFKTLSLYNPYISKTYHFVEDSVELVALDENGVSITYSPASINSSVSMQSNDLDQNATYTISDEYNILDGELDLIPMDSFDETTATFRGYMGDYLDSPTEVVSYTVNSIAQSKGSFTLRTGVPDLNSDQTGQIYDFDTFPMSRAIF
jgi:hypothetical protein